MSTFIFDLDGTLYRDNVALPGARETVAFLRDQGHHILFATNDATQTRLTQQNKLHKLGFPVEAKELMTAAYSTAMYLNSLPKPVHSVFVIGSDALREEIMTCNPCIRIDGVAPVDAVVVSFDPLFSYSHIEYALDAVYSGACLIATNRDPQYPGRTKILPGAGSIVAAIETACLTPAHLIGKPSPYMYQSLMENIGADPATTIVVGDNLLTDIAAAKQLDLFSIQVLTGVSNSATYNALLQPDMIIPSVAEILPTLEKERPDLLTPVFR